MSLWIDPAVCQAAILAVAVVASVVGFKWFAPTRTEREP